MHIRHGDDPFRYASLPTTNDIGFEHFTDTQVRLSSPPRPHRPASARQRRPLHPPGRGMPVHAQRTWPAYPRLPLPDLSEAVAICCINN